MSDKHAWVSLRAALDHKPDATQVTINRETAEAMLAEIARLQRIIAACQWYWDADDSEECFSDPWEVVDQLDDGDISEVWRGGKVETLFVSKVGDELVNEPTLDAAKAKVSELKARSATEVADTIAAEQTH